MLCILHSMTIAFAILVWCNHEKCTMWIWMRWFQPIGHCHVGILFFCFHRFGCLQGSLIWVGCMDKCQYTVMFFTGWLYGGEAYWLPFFTMVWLKSGFSIVMLWKSKYSHNEFFFTCLFPCSYGTWVGCISVVMMRNPNIVIKSFLLVCCKVYIEHWIVVSAKFSLLKMTVWKNQQTESTKSLHNLGNRTTNKGKRSAWSPAGCSFDKNHLESSKLPPLQLASKCIVS